MLLPKPGKKKKKSALQKKKDNPNSKYWKTKADKEWGRIIHLEESCLVGGNCAGPLQAHHLISRGKVLTRHEVENGVLLCAFHHTFSTECSPHAAPIQFTEFLRLYYPEKIEYVMKNRWRQGKPNYKERYEELIKIV